MLNVHYNFYWHLNPKFPAAEVTKAIEAHDYNGFMKIYKEWGNFYLPNTAYVYSGNDYSRSVVVDITDEFNFKEITSSEYECG